ncbi:hypothetical protein DYBT9275_01305 [Dyadobacter sp. CECT 9275]|uniref:DUF4345 domain-containing protein n=1 Tax=Dyadobacter helix TaxID=2822344 RepID=A0A916JB08_9BACT|nr:DUF4345 domain-containing protein [Dyadobacter sp. CECT 9275]CAG4994061.1 hypothetical protein DYBT9275_01305 [Dyadobacter sp. CECT 9275]
MKIQKLLSQTFIILSALSIASVSIMAFQDPQSVMDLVRVQLPNNDALSSIRGVYGGVGFTIVISLVYSVRNYIQHALAFLTLLWGFYALSRLLTIIMDGPLGDFGNMWIKTESVLCLVSLALLLWNKKQPAIR